MSSAYPLYGGTPAQPCQRCGMALPPNETYCRNCGYYNTPAQGSSGAGSTPANVAWGTAAPPTSYGSQNQYAGQQWGQPSSPVPTDQNNFYGQDPVPQLSFDMPVHQSAPNNYSGPAAPTINNGNYYSGASQQGAYYAGPATPQQSFYPPAAAPGMNMGFQQGTMNDSPPMMGNQLLMPRSRGPNVGLIVGIILLLVVLVGGGIASYVFIFAHHTAQVTQTATAVPATPTPKVAPLFADAFNNNNGWDLQGSPGKFSVTLGNGRMALEDDDNKLLWELVPGNKTFRDFKLSIDAILSKGDQMNGYGVYIRGSLDQNSNLTTYYRFELYGDGTYAVFKGNVDSSGKSTPSKIAGYTSSSAIQKQGKLNHIDIIAKGSTMTLVVNGQALQTITDSSYTSGSLALFVSNVQNAPAGATATFSHFAVYPPQA